MYKTRSNYLPVSAEEMKSLIILTESNPNVAAALHFFMKCDWVSLYKAWEMARDAAGGNHDLVNKGWAERRKQNRFTGTAQSREELGDEARHASEQYKPPKDPMSLNEARSFVRSILQAWTNSIK
jgi:hypothetical protein